MEMVANPQRAQGNTIQGSPGQLKEKQGGR